MEGRRILKERFVYHLVKVFFLCLFVGSISAHEGNQEKSILKACDKTPYASSAKPLAQPPPNYPRKALFNFLEANLLVEFKVNKLGEVEDPEVVWQHQTGDYRFKPGDHSHKNIFVRNTLAAVKRYKYEPRKTKEGEIVESKEKVLIAFRLEGYEDILYIDNKKFDKILRESRRVRDHKSKKGIASLKNIIKSIETELEEGDLISIEKAAFLYLKALTLESLGAPNEEIRKVLLDSKTNYEYEIIETLKGGIEVKSVTSEKLNSFGALLLADSYFRDSDYENVEHELIHLFNSSRSNIFSQKRFLPSLLQLGIASYTLRNWCNANEALERAKVLSKSSKVTFPSYLEEPLKYAKSQVK